MASLVDRERHQSHSAMYFSLVPSTSMFEPSPEHEIRTSPSIVDLEERPNQAKGFVCIDSRVEVK